MRCASVPTCEVRRPKGHEPEALRASRELARAGFELRASCFEASDTMPLLPSPPSPLVSPAGAFRIRESECESEFRIRAPCVRPPRGSEDQTFREVSASERWEAACIVRPGMTKTRAVCRAHSHSTFEVRSPKPEPRSTMRMQYACMLEKQSPSNLPGPMRCNAMKAFNPGPGWQESKQTPRPVQAA